MKTTSLMVFLSGLLTFTLVSCKKHKEEKPAEPNTITLLTQKKWIPEYTYVTVGTHTQFGEVRDCVLDDNYEFTPDATGLYNNGLLRCFEENQQSTPLSWSLKENNTILSVKGTFVGDLSGENKIGQLNEHTLELYEDVVQDGIAYRIGIRLKH
jgi:hypothetical protein